MRSTMWWKCATPKKSGLTRMARKPVYQPSRTGSMQARNVNSSLSQNITILSVLRLSEGLRAVQYLNGATTWFRQQIQSVQAWRQNLELR